MNIAKRSGNILTSFLKAYGPSNIKKILWDREFSGTKWDFIDDTAGDCVYPHLEKYARGGDILDLGCGPGNTANELAGSAYKTYVGVDISEAALEKARQRTAKNGRTDKNTFVVGDFIKYEPTQKFDVILFRESMYHVPIIKIKETLDHYSNYLQKDGVFVIRIATSDKEHQGEEKPRPAAMVQVMEREFEVVEKHRHEGVSRPTVLVLRPRNRG